jgi:hypothetical protein
MLPSTLYIHICIPIRLALSYVAWRWRDNTSFLFFYGLLLLIPSFGFLSLFFFNLRLTAPEAGGKTWWAPIRLIHGALFLTSSIYGLREYNIMWIPLLIDALLGITLGIWKSFKTNPVILG